MGRFAALILSILFLGYGLIRLVVGSLLLSQALGFIDIVTFQDPIHDVGRFLANKEAQALVPMSTTGYLVYITLMGASLTAGALGTLMNHRFGLLLIGVFALLWGGLFLNFFTINPKIFQFAVFVGLYVVLVWLKGAASRTT